MPTVVIASYKPKAGGEAKLIELMKAHGPALREQKLATDYPVTFLKSEDGTYHEVFEWVSEEAARSAHDNPVIGPMWEAFADVCEFTPLASIDQAKTPFCHFERVEL